MIVETGKQKKKLSVYLDEGIYKTVLIIFWHGIGDCVMFQVIFDKLKELYPTIHFDIGLAKGLDEQVIIPDAILLDNLDHLEEMGYDLVALIHFPVEVPGLTKSELCCRDELGIEPIWGHKKLLIPKSPLVGVCFHLTSLPGLANPDRETAQKIWNEIKETGFIPIETTIEHCYHNPENQKHNFIDCTARKTKPSIKNLMGLIGNCFAFVGVVSGNFHCTMSLLPQHKICFLEKSIPLERFTKHNIKKVDINNYLEGQIKEWLESIKEL